MYMFAHIFMMRNTYKAAVLLKTHTCHQSLCCLCCWLPQAAAAAAALLLLVASAVGCLRLLPLLSSFGVSRHCSTLPPLRRRCRVMSIRGAPGVSEEDEDGPEEEPESEPEPEPADPEEEEVLL